jgi:hypothetical protein
MCCDDVCVAENCDRIEHVNDRSDGARGSECVAGGSFIAHPISLVVNGIRALLALPVSGRVATKAR